MKDNLYDSRNAAETDHLRFVAARRRYCACIELFSSESLGFCSQSPICHHVLEKTLFETTNGTTQAQPGKS